MGITDQCKAAMIEHGVFMVDLPDGSEVPAGMQNLLKKKLTVALIQADNDGNYQFDFDPARYPLAKDNYVAGTFPDGFEDVAVQAFQYMYDGEIEFVEPKDWPDVVVFATEGGLYSGIATLPLNNHEFHKRHGHEYPVIGISTKLGWVEESITLEDLRDTLEHEIGHALAGIHHPAFAKDEIELNAKDNEHTSHVCSGAEQEVELDKIFDYGEKEALMSMGGHGHETWYDRGARDFVKTGVPPNPNTLPKP